MTEAAVQRPRGRTGWGESQGSTIVQAPGSPHPSLPRLDSNPVLKPPARHHMQWRQHSTTDCFTLQDSFLASLREPFPEITCQTSPLFICTELGPMTILNQLLAMRKGSSLVETSQDFPPTLWGGMEPQILLANSKEWPGSLNNVCHKPIGRVLHSGRKE